MTKPNQHYLYQQTISTPLGDMFACATDNGLCLLEFTDRKNFELQVKKLNNGLKLPCLQQDNTHITQTRRELAEYFKGERTQFDVALHPVGTAFQQTAWQALVAIPYGETRSYAEQAVAIGNAKAVRAVASANANNKIAVIIPCHRVIGSNGKLTGYAGGLARKQQLLALEGAL